jgi:hypothetical protein
MTVVAKPIGPPQVETDLRRVYDLPPRPPDDVLALRMQCSPHDVWERSRVDPTRWSNARTGIFMSYRELVAKHAPLREYLLPAATVWVVRSDAIIPPQVHGIYSNEPAAIAAAGGHGDRRVHPWQVLDQPAEEHYGGGPDGNHV